MAESESQEPLPDDRLCARYCRQRRWLALGEALFQLTAMTALSTSGATRWLLDLVADAGHWPVQAAAYLALVGVAVRFAALPWRFARDFVLERRYGLCTQTVAGWAWEWFLRSALFGALAVVTLLPIALTLPHWPWMLVPWFVYFLLLRWLYYHWIYAPLLRRLYPTRLLRHESFHLPGVGRRTLPVYEVRVSHKTRRVEAHIHLAGRRSAIYLTDTLVNQFTDGEEKVVLAHEFGHLYDRLVLEERTDLGIRQAKRRLLWGVLQLAAMVFAIVMVDALDPRFGYHGADDLAAFPLLIAVTLALGHLLGPLLQLEARRDEADADEYALRITRDVRNYRSVMEKLRRFNLEEACADPLAQFLFDNHPSYSERLRLADEIPLRRRRARR